MTDLKLFPKHNFGLYLTHNEHRDCSMTAAEYLADCETRECAANWIDDTDKRRAIETDEIWELQWYPRTSISFYRVAASSLDNLLAFALEVEKEK